MLYKHNVHAQPFRMSRDKLSEGTVPNMKFCLISKRSIAGRIYNQPTISEVASLIVGDIDRVEKKHYNAETMW